MTEEDRERLRKRAWMILLPYKDTPKTRSAWARGFLEGTVLRIQTKRNKELKKIERRRKNQEKKVKKEQHTR